MSSLEYEVLLMCQYECRDVAEYNIPGTKTGLHQTKMFMRVLLALANGRLSSHLHMKCHYGRTWLAVNARNYCYCHHRTYCLALTVETGRLLNTMNQCKQPVKFAHRLK